MVSDVSFGDVMEFLRIELLLLLLLVVVFGLFEKDNGGCGGGNGK